MQPGLHRPGLFIWGVDVACPGVLGDPSQAHMGCPGQVNEEPGTYFWHGHSGMEKVDGFFGPLIVRPRGPEPFQYDEERILLLDDNYHEQAGPLSFRLNRRAPGLVQGSTWPTAGAPTRLLMLQIAPPLCYLLLAGRVMGPDEPRLETCPGEQASS